MESTRKSSKRHHKSKDAKEPVSKAKKHDSETETKEEPKGENLDFEDEHEDIIGIRLL